MSNFEPKLQDSEDEGLRHLINFSSPNFGSLASDELSRREMKKLRDSIKELDKTTARYSQKILVFTFVLVVVAIFQLAAAIFVLDLTLWWKLGILAAAVTVLVYVLVSLIKDSEGE